MEHAIHRVEHFEIVGPYTLPLKFDDGSQQRIDFRPVLRHGAPVGQDHGTSSSNGWLTLRWSRRRLGCRVRAAAHRQRKTAPITNDAATTGKDGERTQ